MQFPAGRSKEGFRRRRLSVELLAASWFKLRRARSGFAHDLKSHPHLLLIEQADVQVGDALVTVDLLDAVDVTA